MFPRKLILIIYLLLALFSSSAVLNADEKREFIIEGLRIFNRDELIKILNLDEKQKPGKEVAADISQFYKKNGYSLVKVYVVEDFRDRLALYVNEGRLDKIIVHGLNNYYSLKFKQNINFPGRIYNTEITEQNISRIKKKYGIAEIRTELKQVADYSDSLFQIDRDLKKIHIFGNNLKLFSDYPPEYDLHFYPEKGEKMNGLSIRREGFSFNIDYSYPSEIIPEISWYKNNIFYGKDYLELNFSSGFDPGLKGFISISPSNTLNIPPERSFSQLLGEYKFNPYKNDFFGPLIRSKLYQSRSSRSDFGLNTYEYFQSRFTLAPEFTLLNYFNIYAGFGYERTNFYEIDKDETAEYPMEIEDGVADYPFFESRIKIDPIPIRLGNRIDKYLLFTLTEYFGEKSSRELQLTGAYDFEFSDLSIYSLKFKANINLYDTPFYHNAAVNSQFFKGFSGNSYFTNRGLSISNEYRISIYQDYIYAGAFVDVTTFDPEGYILSGTKYGIAAGPTGRFLFYDQFELIVYYSIDRLIPEGNIGTNFQIKFRKKW